MTDQPEPSPAESTRKSLEHPSTFCPDVLYHGELRARLRGAEAERAARVAAGVFDAVPRVSRALAGKDVLVTGGSGFMGRVLLEKLLRSCPDIGTVYLLLRAKKGVALADRVAGIVNVPVPCTAQRPPPARAPAPEPCVASPSITA
ncbi:Putative fatty acyl-CoA reductase [Frankliniella fusca]|uniref:Fatty acyl-CoA reductase n=1 Tax=Frankliniella fusca TaxID=407009 RepID=A0AAE1HZG9_9NEOP|nr:Putative fatty acyl-CoA reductase [Frankliniella fusca]